MRGDSIGDDDQVRRIHQANLRPIAAREGENICPALDGSDTIADIVNNTDAFRAQRSGVIQRESIISLKGKDVGGIYRRIEHADPHLPRAGFSGIGKRG